MALLTAAVSCRSPCRCVCGAPTAVIMRFPPLEQTFPDSHTKYQHAAEPCVTEYKQSPTQLSVLLCRYTGRGWFLMRSVHGGVLLWRDCIDKMIDIWEHTRGVLAQVLQKWKAAGHKALLFTQTQQMLDIIEHHVASAGMRYLRMDGSVPPPSRFRMIDAFNRHPPPGPLQPLPGSDGGGAAAAADHGGAGASGDGGDMAGLEDDDVIVSAATAADMHGAHAGASKKNGGQTHEAIEDDGDDALDAVQVSPTLLPSVNSNRAFNSTCSLQIWRSCDQMCSTATF